ncbi:sarcosine oxidase, partial [Coccomyxa subellipsoidea C-169]
ISSVAMANFDVVVVGIGGHGSAALYHLAKRGFKVLGLEQFSIAHDLGSSHGHSRIIRLQYHEHPDYVPLLRRAYELWHKLEAESGQVALFLERNQLLYTTGCLEFADKANADSVFANALRSAMEHGLEHEVLSSEEANARFPGFHIPSNFMALYQPQGGILSPEKCIKAHVERAVQHGATVHTEEKVLAWHVLPSGNVEVRTAKGAYTASKLVVTAGAWIPQLVPELQGIAAVQRQVIGWFEVSDHEAFSTDNFPVFILEDETLGEYYGFPEFDGLPGMKIGKFYHLYEPCEQPDNLTRIITSADEEVLRAAVKKYFPKADGKMCKAVACMFTNTPDKRFIVDFHPEHPQVVLCSACSGHGYKFCSVIGEILADLVVKGSTALNIDLHRISKSRKATRDIAGSLSR